MSAFQHFKIALSTLNPGDQYTCHFDMYTGPRLVKYCPGSIPVTGIEWLSRSGNGPGCLYGLVRRRLTTMPETRVRVLAWSSPKILQKSSRCEKTDVQVARLASSLPSRPVYMSFRPVYMSFRPVYRPFVRYTCHRAPGSVLSSITAL